MTLLFQIFTNAKERVIWNLDYPARQFSEKMGASAAVTMDTGMFIFGACADAHMHCCLSIKWVDQGMIYPFDYPACLRNQGVRIIEVLLYWEYNTVPLLNEGAAF